MEIKNKVTETFDEIFLKLNQRKLYENQNFKVNAKFANEFSTLFDSVEKENRINISFWIGENNSVEFYIDRTNELPTFSEKMIESNPSEFYNFIFDLFSSKLLVQYRGNKTIIHFLNIRGDKFRKLTFQDNKKNVVEKLEENLYDGFFHC
ncbi:hypothetical protein [Chryseobacterium sp. R2A-55]|uniref:hypothetical protein n=1 Tax=Chryseobacterium sp. R2A-55 TaxID=2744445 RepID=UPI001F421CF5|nr:hypothetical protein [Chryseobacterium sp. R2A-55]